MWRQPSGNLLDNAAEALPGMPGRSESPSPLAWSGNILHIREQNPAPVGPVSHDRRTPDGERGINHILRELAERYDGSFTLPCGAQ
ncbi:MAG: hypothetical protein ACLR5H_10930 [Oscillospiraceae bacterium]